MNDPLIFPEMWDLARIIEHMTAAAERQAGLTPAQCMQRDLQQTADFNAWRHEVDAVGESAAMDGLRVGGVAGCAHSQSGDLTCWCSACNRTRQETAGSIPAADHPSLQLPETVSIAGRLIPGSDDGVQRRAPIQYNLCEQKGGQAGETVNPDEFSFDPACRELAAHFLPGAPGLSVDYLAQALMDCAQEYLAQKEEFRK